MRVPALYVMRVPALRMGTVTVPGAKPVAAPAGRVEILVEAAFAILLDQRR
ncbi:hypothetical protein [Actinoallomurus sp. NPDC050550]|uniref:hypothetical protein n=1 Tax=Actinoallomurus sp. NPDC050550 TaxID=3154937 RepID=UPI00340CCD78